MCNNLKDPYNPKCECGELADYMIIREGSDTTICCKECLRVTDIIEELI